MKTRLTILKKLGQDQGALGSTVACLFFLLAVAPSARAQVQTTGTPGSPSVTTTIDGRYIPNPPPPFAGKVNLSAVDSKPGWPPTVVPPKGAPNVLLIMTDDQGYGVSGTFGGVIPTPAMDRLAKAGLRYTQFHSTALCSPTRVLKIPSLGCTPSSKTKNPAFTLSGWTVLVAHGGAPISSPSRTLPGPAIPHKSPL